MVNINCRAIAELSLFPARDKGSEFNCCYCYSNIQQLEDKQHIFLCVKVNKDVTVDHQMTKNKETKWTHSVQMLR